APCGAMGPGSIFSDVVQVPTIVLLSFSISGEGFGIGIEDAAELDLPLFLAAGLSWAIAHAASKAINIIVCTNFMSTASWKSKPRGNYRRTAAPVKPSLRGSLPFCRALAKLFDGDGVRHNRLPPG